MCTHTCIKTVAESNSIYIKEISKTDPKFTKNHQVQFSFLRQINGPSI